MDSLWILIKEDARSVQSNTSNVNFNPLPDLMLANLAYSPI